MSTHQTVPSFLLALTTPIGRLEIASDGEAITRLTRESDGRLPHDDLEPRVNDVLHEAAAQIDEYFSGDRRTFTLPFTPMGTRFQQAVWKALEDVPYGTTTTYSALSHAATGRRASRAAGQAVAANSLLLLIPTHRVVSRSGGVQGYSGTDGAEAKSWLLDHEKSIGG